MIYPGYLLNPGDMFQVEPERVLFATGAPKDAKERRATRVLRRRMAKTKEETAGEEAAEETGEEAAEGEVEPAAVAEPAPETPEASEADADAVADSAEAAKRKAYKVNLKDLMKSAKDILADKREVPSAKRKQELRAFTTTVRKALAQANRTSLNSLDDELSTLLSQLSVAAPSSSTSSTPSAKPEANDPTTEPELISEQDRKALREAMREARENPVDASKPYATPWRPRPYMAPFAFVPRYLEVNQNICAAVYLRHPVARPGLAEVPTPFAPETSQLAFNWYLRRR